MQSNREDSIRDALERRIKIAGLQGFFGEIIVPTETVSEFKAGKKRVVDEALSRLHRRQHGNQRGVVVPGAQTPGIGDFTDRRKAQPHVVARGKPHRIEGRGKDRRTPKLKISCKPGDRVKITEGTFENFEGDVDTSTSRTAT